MMFVSVTTASLVQCPTVLFDILSHPGAFLTSVWGIWFLSYSAFVKSLPWTFGFLPILQVCPSTPFSWSFPSSRCVFNLLYLTTLSANASYFEKKRTNRSLLIISILWSSKNHTLEGQADVNGPLIIPWKAVSIPFPLVDLSCGQFFCLLKLLYVVQSL